MHNGQSNFYVRSDILIYIYIYIFPLSFPYDPFYMHRIIMIIIIQLYIYRCVHLNATNADLGDSTSRDGSFFPF